MPTQDRRSFIPQAIECFMLQDWPDRELVIVDSGTDRVEDLFVGIPNARYLYYREKNRPSWLPHTPIGTKRNRACEYSRGEIICHWDDDDWSEPGRIRAHVEMMLQTGKSVVGFTRIRTRDIETGVIGEMAVEYACGTSLCYRRDFWDTHRFPATSFGEDWTFVETALEAGELYSTDGREYITAATHPGNTCKR